MSEVGCMHEADQEAFCLFHPFTDSQNKYPTTVKQKYAHNLKLPLTLKGLLPRQPEN